MEPYRAAARLWVRLGSSGCFAFNLHVTLHAGRRIGLSARWASAARPQSCGRAAMRTRLDAAGQQAVPTAFWHSPWRRCKAARHRVGTTAAVPLRLQFASPSFIETNADVMHPGPTLAGRGTLRRGYGTSAGWGPGARCARRRCSTPSRRTSRARTLRRWTGTATAPCSLPAPTTALPASGPKTVRQGLVQGLDPLASTSARVDYTAAKQHSDGCMQTLLGSVLSGEILWSRLGAWPCRPWR